VSGWPSKLRRRPEIGRATFDGGAGTPNQRVWNLVNKGRVFRELLLHPLVRGVVTHLLGPDFILMAPPSHEPLRTSPPSLMTALANSVYDVSPDGQRFLFVKANTENGPPEEARVLLNWTKELKQLTSPGK